MKNKNTLRILLLMLCVILTVGLVTGITMADQSPWSAVDVQDSYSYGDEFAVPQRTVTVGGKEVAATHTVIYPDGSSTLKSKITLNMSGLYTISYRAEVDGTPYVEEVTFTVADHLFYFDTEKSSAVYQSGKGLMVELAEGDAMHFNAVLDMNAMSLQKVLLEAFATPAENGRFDFKRLYFTFTDVEDPSKTLTFSARHTASTVDAPYTYAMVAGDGQLLTGMEFFNNEWKKHVEGVSNFGQPFPHSFKDSTKGTIQFRYDNASLTAYVGVRAIAELNNPEHFTTLWEGFTSGRVRLSITAGMYEGAVARFCLKSLYGVDLSTQELKDTAGPVITVENPYGSNMPAAVKGGTYQIFPAAARDANTGDCDVKVNVWYNHTANNAVLIDVVDGQFTTEFAGTYAIVYTATDRLGNKSEEILWLNSYKELDMPTIEVAQAGDAELVLGQLLTPAKYKAVSRSGAAQVKITAASGTEQWDITNTPFRPEQAGEYVVTYSVTDFTGRTVSASYKVIAKAGDKPVFVDSPVFPAVLISGAEYKLPELYVNDYRSGKLERKQVCAQITDSEGTRDIAIGGSFVPKVANNQEKVTVVYTADGVALEREIPVIQPWFTEEGSSRPKLNLDNYLYMENGALSYVKKDDAITVTANEANAGWLFANQMASENLELTIKAIAGKSNFTALAITYTDAQDPSITVTVKLINKGTGKAQVQLGAVEAAAPGAFGTGDQFVIRYAKNKIMVGNASYSVLTDDAGNTFAGFPSGKVSVGVSFVGARKGAAYDLVTVNGYAMSNLTSDRTGPNIVVLGEYGGSVAFGGETVIPAAMASDTLDPNVTFTMTVKDPAGNVVTAKDGTYLENADPGKAYTIMMDQYGQYSVRLVASDTFNARNNETVLPYTINVDDEVAPVVSITSSAVEKARVGDVLVMPTFTVQDNVTPAEEIAIAKFVYTPNGRLIPLTGQSNAITAAYEGVYEFRIYVADKAGNICFIRNTITVTAN